MKISFFEEFLSDIKETESKVIVATKSLEKFNSINLKNKVYWPVLSKKEGYWISPFSSFKGLKRIFLELKNKKIPIMLDLELPTTQNWKLYFKSYNFFKNKKMIKKFVDSYKGQIYLCEYFPEKVWQENFLEKLGLHYSNQTCKIIKMFYQSIHNFNEEFMIKHIKKGVENFEDKFVVGIGTIAVGIHGNEKILSAEELERDLKICKDLGVSEVIIFRLGGLNYKYKKVINKFR